jgi:hypothetical protein
MADVALGRESRHRGFWGYYITTTKMPILPQSIAELQRMTEDQRWFRSLAWTHTQRLRRLVQTKP